MTVNLAAACDKVNSHTSEHRDVWAPGQMGAAVSAPDDSALGATVTFVLAERQLWC